MKFDIERAWKDENYRLSLSEEQLSALPANPVGELSDADLEAINGGWFGGGGLGGPGFGGGFGGGFGPCIHTHASSNGLICEINVFTVNANVLAIPLQILSGPNSNCVGIH